MKIKNKKKNIKILNIQAIWGINNLFIKKQIKKINK